MNRQTAKEVLKLKRKLTSNLPQGALGKLHLLYTQAVVKGIKPRKSLRSLTAKVGDELGFKVESKDIPKDALDMIAANDPEVRTQGLTLALAKVAGKIIAKKKLYPNADGKQLSVITKRWAEDVVQRIVGLPQLRRKKLLADRKCRLKNYVIRCPICEATEDDMEKDYEKLSATCSKCGWSKVFDGSGKRTAKPKKNKPQKATTSGSKS